MVVVGAIVSEPVSVRVAVGELVVVGAIVGEPVIVAVGENKRCM